jgi:hypothetical protein
VVKNCCAAVVAFTIEASTASTAVISQVSPVWIRLQIAVAIQRFGHAQAAECSGMVEATLESYNSALRCGKLYAQPLSLDVGMPVQALTSMAPSSPSGWRDTRTAEGVNPVRRI